MAITLNRKSYVDLLVGDIEWLRRQPQSLERDHIESLIAVGMRTDVTSPLELLVLNLIACNAVHKRKGTVLGEESWATLIDHLKEEVEEFEETLGNGVDDGDQLSELADVLGLIVHAAAKLGFTMEQVERREIAKLRERFDVPVKDAQ